MLYFIVVIFWVDGWVKDKDKGMFEEEIGSFCLPMDIVHSNVIDLLWAEPNQGIPYPKVCQVL